jgi:hypothetical protein
VLIGLTVCSAMCGPDLVGTLADTVFQTLIHVKLSCLGMIGASFIPQHS